MHYGLSNPKKNVSQITKSGIVIPEFDLSFHFTMAMLFDSFVVVCLPSTTFSLVDDHQTFVKLLRYAGLRLRLIATMRKCDMMKRRWIEEESE